MGPSSNIKVSSNKFRELTTFSAFDKINLSYPLRFSVFFVGIGEKNDQKPTDF
jgi:hypothetical protein